MSKDIKIGTLMFGILSSAALSAILLWTFLSAYFTSSKITSISINSFGEANWELPLIIITFIMIIISSIYSIKKVIKEDINVNSRTY